MTNPTLTAQQPLLFQFFDNFLQERNIRWLLALGTLILFGSSVMLVATHWQDYTPTWKFLIMLAYTGMIFGAGQWTYHKLVLHKTGTVLSALTVLLLPALFLALHWVQQPSADFGTASLNLSLLALTLAFAAVAAGRIFKHFLRSSQPTFLASYLILCLTGALAPLLPSTAAPWAALGLWAVFTIGSIKVNRHVFWLSEQHRSPRIFAFFPILLLGTLFLGLFTLLFAAQIKIEWLGFGCVLTALTILITADIIVRVFQQRTGGLVAPYPAAIILPLGLGLVLCAAGLALSGAGLMPDHSPLAITPTALLTAVIFGLAAHRTQKQALVWAALLSAMIAYNFAPFFFKDHAYRLLDAGAAAVKEEKLPYAFYGLTYLPLIAAFTALGIWTHRIGATLYAKPLRIVSVAIPCLLLALAFSHNKALLPVALTMLCVFILQTIYYRNPWLAFPALLAWIISAFTLAPFAIDVLGAALWPTATTVCAAVAAALLLVFGSRLDSSLHCLNTSAFWPDLPVCQLASLIVSLILALNWITSGPIIAHATEFSQLLPVILMTGLLIAHSLRWQRVLLSSMALLFMQYHLVILALSFNIDFNDLVSLITLMLLLQWVLHYGFKAMAQHQISLAFAPANKWLSMIGLSTAFMLVYLPFSLVDIGAEGDLDRYGPWWSCRILLLVWLFDAGRKGRYGVGTLLGLIGVLSLTNEWLAIQFGAVAWYWLACLTSLTAVARKHYLASYLHASKIARALQMLPFYLIIGCTLLATLLLPAPSTLEIIIAAATFAVLVLGELWSACRSQREIRVVIAELLVALALVYFAEQDVLHFGRGLSMYLLLAGAFISLLIAAYAVHRPVIGILARPMRLTGMALPIISVLLGLYRYFSDAQTLWLGQNSLALLLSAGFYFWRGIEQRRSLYLLGAALIANTALALLWRELSWSDPQFFMVPLGVTVLGLVRLLNDQIPQRLHNPLYYLGALIVLVSPLFHIASGSWIHLFTLMLGSVVMVLIAIGLQVRALIYTGAAFLVTDLLAIIVRSSIDNPNMLWIAGLLLGAGVVFLGAAAERNRERLLQRLRAVSATLESWQ